MKAQIHPTFYEDAVVHCVCGNTFTTGSTRKELRTEVCAACDDVIDEDAHDAGVCGVRVDDDDLLTHPG